jgi:hypothetical protein
MADGCTLTIGGRDRVRLTRRVGDFGTNPLLGAFHE